MVEVRLGGRVVRGLVDTGCSAALVRTRLVHNCEDESYMTAFDGREVKCQGMCWVVDGRPSKIHA